MQLYRSQARIIIILIILTLLYSGFSGFFGPLSVNSRDGAVNSSCNFRDLEIDIIKTRNFRADVDVGIGVVGDVTAQTQPDHYPGIPITMNCTVQEYLNTTVPNSFIVLLTIDDNVEDIPGYHYQDNQTVFPTQLPANGSLELFWNWTPPLHPPPGGSWNYFGVGHNFTVIFTTIYDFDINSNNNQMKLNVTVKKSPYDIEIFSGWNFEPEPVKTITIDPENGTQFPLNFTIFNLGKETWIDFNITIPTDWQASEPPTIFMATGSNTSSNNLSIIVYPSINREYIPTQIELPITLKAISRRYPLENASVTFYVKINFIPYPEIIPPNIPTIPPPGEHYINFTVTNDGNGQDSFMSEVTVGQTLFEKEKLAEQGWSAIVHSGKYSYILDRGDNHTVVVRVTIPSTVPAGTPCSINFTVFSEKAMFACPNHPYAVKSGFFDIYAAKWKSVDIQDQIPAINMTPASVASISFTIRNIGNSVDSSITCNITEILEGWNATLDLSDIPFTGLGRQAIADIVIEITTPKEVVRGKYQIKIVGISEGEIKDESNITVNILKAKSIKITSLFNEIEIDPGEVNNFNITIENNGNSMDYLELDYICEPLNSGLENYIELEYMSILLGPYSSYNLSVRLNIPQDFSADSNLDTPQQDPYSLQIKVVNEPDASVNHILNLDINIKPFHNFRIIPDSYVKYIVRNSDRYAIYELNITNSGNFGDTIDFSYREQSGTVNNLIIMPLHKTVLFRDSDKVDFEVGPFPSDIPIEDYEFIINCTSAGDHTVSNSVNLVLKVIDYDLRISNLRFDDKIAKNLNILEGSRVKISADISYEYYDSGSSKYPMSSEIDPRTYPVNITIFDNDLEIPNGSTMLRLLGDKHSQMIDLYWTAETQGMHKLSVEVDPNNFIRESDETNNSIEILVLVEDQFPSYHSEDGFSVVLTPNGVAIISSAIILIAFAAFVGGTELGKFKLLIGILPLYTRLKKNKILDHETRGMIRGYIIANPGVHFNYIKRELGFKNGALAYHIKVLEQGEFIKVERDGMYTRFYPMKNGAYYKGAFNGIRVSEIQKKIVRQIRVKPGVTQKKISEKTGIKQQTVSRNIKVLLKKNVIKVKKAGRKRYCYFNSEIELKDS